MVVSVNPLQNLVHVAVGLGLLWIVYRSRWALPGTAAAPEPVPEIGIARGTQPLYSASNSAAVTPSMVPVDSRP